MTTTLPTVPAFVANDTSLLKLQQLAYAVSFLSDSSVRPTFHAIKTATLAISATTWTAIPHDLICYDNDGVFTASTTNATIQTQGIYRFEATVPVQTTSTSLVAMYAAFFVTAGTHNSHHSSGTTMYFGMESGGSCGLGTVIDTTFSIGSFCPWTLYLGDTVQVRVYYGVTSTIDKCDPTGYMTSTMSNSFSGQWIKNGS